MKPSEWRWIKGLRGLLAMPRPEPLRQAERIVLMQRNIVLPAKAGLFAVVTCYLFLPGWLYPESTTNWVMYRGVQAFFLIYVLCNALICPVFFLKQRFTPRIFQWVVFAMGILDGLFISGLVLVTGGFGSMGYWVYPGLIVLNAISIPLATPQIVLNLLLSVFYLGAGFSYSYTSIQEQLPPLFVPMRSAAALNRTNVQDEFSQPTAPVAGTNASNTSPRSRRSHLGWDPTIPPPVVEESAPPFVLHAFVLWLLTACCYGVQLLVERQRRNTEEEREFAAREAQLRTAGRLAAEIAHQLKNPLAIINNTIFSLNRAGKEGKPASPAQVQIIQEEVSHADHILTNLMGYAQLAEGRVEKLSVTEELDRAIAEVFPPAAEFRVEIERRYASYFPPLMMQRPHLSSIFVNLLQNAREALHGVGSVSVAASCHADSSIEIRIGDNGPGIPPDKLSSIFEPYFTTKEKGTGLGLAMVKHNVELYSGTVRVESELGKGARFVLLFPAKSVINLSRKHKT
jgi:signal transduction histidine kinase